jgi:hypothetical protein
MQAFLSYQNQDKAVAARVQVLLTSIGIEPFMAHEDIQVSEVWRTVLLDRLGTADLFVAILSVRYSQSPYCLQEAGIAAFRQIPIVPLSIDGTTPFALFNHIQSTNINPDNPPLNPLLRGAAKADPGFVIDGLTRRLVGSHSYREAEANFQLLNPYLAQATDAQKTAVLVAASENGQVSDASLCARDYLPPLIKSHGHLLKPEVLKTLTDTVKRNSPSPPPR